MCFHVSVVVVYTNTVAHAILVLITIAVWAVVAHVVVCSWFGLFVLLLVVVCVCVCVGYRSDCSPWAAVCKKMFCT